MAIEHFPCFAFFSWFQRLSLAGAHASPDGAANEDRAIDLIGTMTVTVLAIKHGDRVQKLLYAGLHIRDYHNS